MSEIKRIDVTITANQKIILDSENKQVISEIYGTKNNAYNSIDHSKNTFIIAESGNTIINVQNGFKFNIEYKKWVMD